MHPWKSYGDTDFVTGLRAYAALAVVMIHSGGAGLLQFGSVGQHFARLGGAGVYIFFVISGFSVAASYGASPSYGDYLARRLLRVAPLYYLWLVIAAAGVGLSYWGQHLGARLDAYNWFMHLSFLSFLDYRMANSMLSVEWTLAIEVFWYVALPWLFRPIMAHRHGVPVALVASLGLYLLTRQLQGMLPLPAEDAQLLVEWSPLPYAFSYCLGICAYKIRKPRGDAAIAAVLAAAALFALWPVDLMDRYVFVSFATFALVSMGSGRSAICRVLFTNRAVLFLGAISYGLYLAHFPLKMMMGLEGRHDVLAFLLIVAAATVASTITYYAVERPVRRLAGRWPALVRA